MLTLTGIFYGIFCMIYGANTIEFVDGIPMNNVTFFSIFCGGLIIWIYFCYLIKKLNTTLFEEMFAKVENQRQFQVILENLEESIILVS